MKVKGKLSTDRTDNNWFSLRLAERKDRNKDIYVFQVESEFFDTHDLAKAAAEKFAEEHNMSIEWEGG